MFYGIVNWSGTQSVVYVYKENVTSTFDTINWFYTSKLQARDSKLDSPRAAASRIVTRSSLLARGINLRA